MLFTFVGQTEQDSYTNQTQTEQDDYTNETIHR